VVTAPQLGIEMLKLPIMLGIIFPVLWVNKRKEKGPNVFEELDGKIDLRRLAGLFVMPAVAIIVYALAGAFDLPISFIRAVFWFGIVLATTYGAWIVFWVAVVYCLAPWPYRAKGPVLEGPG
jgi:hypothetical protein